jgi:hypothetical protein
MVCLVQGVKGFLLLQSNRDFQVCKKSLSLDGFLRAADSQHGAVFASPSRLGMKHCQYPPGKKENEKKNDRQWHECP